MEYCVRDNNSLAKCHAADTALWLAINSPDNTNEKAVFVDLLKPLQESDNNRIQQQPDIKVDHQLSSGECSETTKNGQPVKVCLDQNGAYRISPVEKQKVNILADELSEKPMTLLCTSLSALTTPPSTIE